MSEHKVRFSDGKIIAGKIVETNVRFLRQSAMLKCPFTIMVPEHYREDETCKCNDSQHREMMKREWEYTDADFRSAGLIE